MPEAAPPDLPALLAESDAQVFNLDKMGYASDLSSIEALPQAAESHVDRSIKGPAAYGSTSSPHWEALPAERADGFRLHHISTDEVFGSLGPTGRFSETSA